MQNEGANIDISDSWSGPHSLLTSPFSPYFRPDARQNGKKDESRGTGFDQVTALTLGALAVEGRWDEMRAILRQKVKKGAPWQSTAGVCQTLLDLLDDDRAIRDRVRTMGIKVSGNMKLPFAVWSEMPAVTCPGAGGITHILGAYGATTPTDVPGCGKWCYSMNGLRNPSVVQSHLVNTIAMTKGLAWEAIRDSLEALILKHRKVGKQTVFRLYVDGDFRSVESILSWMAIFRSLEHHKDFVAYGYSKSWPEFLEADRLLRKTHQEWPKNYRLNVSSGSRHGKALEGKVMRLPVSRGRFIAVDPTNALTSKHGPMENWPESVRSDYAWWQKQSSIEKMPGVVAQAATHYLLAKHFQDRATFVCPISCATCPSPMLAGKYEASREEIERIGAGGKMAEKVRAFKGNHYCFSAQGRDIVIGIH